MAKTKAQRRQERSKKSRARAKAVLFGATSPTDPGKVGQKNAPSQRWAAIHDRLQSENDLALKKLTPLNQAKRALTPQQRAKPHVIEKTDQGLAARKLHDPLDWYHARGHLGKAARDNERRYRAGTWLRDLWQFINSGHIKSVSLEAIRNQGRGSGKMGPSDPDTMIQRKIDAANKFDRTWERLRDHHPTLKRVLFEGQFVDPTGRSATSRMVPLHEALDAVERVGR